VKDNSRTRLLLATIDLVRGGGYAATRVEDICAAAGVTKGSFFHHFESKEDLARDAAGLWGERAVDLFAHADYMREPDPLDRLLGYLRFRRKLMNGPLWEWTCYAGTTVQETYASHPGLREACGASIGAHLGQLTIMVEQALAAHPGAQVDAASLAAYMQAVIQGAFVMAKARDDRRIAQDCVDHLYRHVEMLFGRSTSKKRHR
jgi:TetR/AcrR family transcriptional repressor of nem operon